MGGFEFVNAEMLAADDGAGAECITNEAQWQDSRPTEVSVIGVRAERFNPISSINNTKVYQFDLTSSLNEVLDPKTVKLIMMYKIVDAQGQDITANAANDLDKVLPVNGIAYAMFKSCEIKVNNKTIAGGDMLYAYKSNIQKRLTVTKPVRDEQGILEGWNQENQAWDDMVDDERKEIFAADQHDKFFQDPLKGPFINRYIDTKLSKPKQLITHVCADIFTQNEFLPMNTKLTVVMTRQDSDQFCYLALKENNKYRIKVMSAQVECQLKIMDLDFIEAEVEKLKKGKLYRSVFKNIEMSEYFFPQGLTDLSKQMLFHLNSVSPDRYFVVLVSQDAKNGAHDKDPFNYQDYTMSEFGHVRSDGRTRHPTVHMRRFGGGVDHEFDVAEPVFNLYKALNLDCNGEDVCGINQYNILHRNFFMGFNLQKNDGATSGEIYDLPDQHSNGIMVHLKKALPEPVVMIIYAEFNTELLIDAFGNVTLKANALA